MSIVNKYNSKQMLSKECRQSNFELLRVICMLLIICGHIVMTHGYGEIGGSSWYIGQVLRSFTCIAVDVFVLISGYFGITLKYKKLIKLNTMVSFYTITFLVVAIILGIHQFNPRTDWMQLIPVITKQYWFITIYFVLCLLSPYLNILTEQLDKSNYKKLLLTATILFVLLPTMGYILNFKSITEDAGYGIVNFCFLYLLGRYLRLHYKIKCNRKVYLLISVISMTMLSVFHICYSLLLGFSFTSLISYDTLFCFIGAVGLFLYFRELNFRSKTINSLASFCLAVYVLHLNPICYKYIYNDLFHFNKYENLQYTALLLIAPVIIFLACTAIEIVRRKLFTFVRID